MNPVRSGIVSKIEDYIYSNTRNYVEENGLVKVELVENKIVNIYKKSSFDKYVNYTSKSPDFE
ncbi:hypothetical protein [Flavobacterium oreochromis]|uniref:hypothetical protein n=1 Tax=Flavobacterium oreochromis TaxID=2906078 RepID=UPI001F0FF037